MPDVILDKALVWATWLQLTPSGDIKMTSGVLANFQTAQIRSLSEITTWLQDDSFGSTLYEVFREKGSYMITEDDMKSAIILAVKPMLDDGRLSSIDAVNILDRTMDTIFVEVIVTAWTVKGKIPLLIS